MNETKTIEEYSLTNLLQIHSLKTLLEQDENASINQSKSIAYYHANIDREKAEDLLKEKYLSTKINGLFLLRNCTTSTYDFSLSIISNEKCYHYKIQLIYHIYFSVDAGPQIAGIENLIRYYQERSDGLICMLAQEFIPGQPPPLSIRSMGITNTLHRACQQNNIQIVKEILSDELKSFRPDVNSKDSQGSTALHEASYYGHDDIVRLLIQSNCQIDVRDANGATPLHRATAGNRPSTIRILIAEGLADYEDRNYTNNWVPLHEAAFYNSSTCLRILLEYGAPIRPRTDQGKTPIQIAEEMKCEESIAILRQYQTPSARSSRLDWFHDQPKFDRQVAKQLMESVVSGPQNGMFVVRYSSKNAKNYALTVYYEKEFFNFEIIRLNERTFFIDDGPYFDSLEHLIDHYCRIPDGLPTILTCSINQYKNLIPIRMLTNSYPNEMKFTTKSTLTISPNHSSIFSSSLNSSITSLNSSSSSRSRASSTQESPLSTSSSNGSLSSTSPPKHISEENLFISRAPIIDRKLKRLTIPIVNIETKSTFKLDLISPSQINQIAKLGEGEFGEVYEGFYRENSTKNVPVAIKILKDYSYSTKQDFLREAEHMSKLNHHCICKLYGIVDSNNNEMMMIIELLLLGSMLDYLWKHQLTLTEERLKLWASQIADGMEYMESKGIVHRDLAARNILLQSTDQVKISDFGLSRCIDTDIYVQKSDSKIPVKWYAPEAISIGKFTSKSDVWSFGVTLWEMFSYGATPYGEKSGSDVYYLLKQGKRLERPVRCPVYIYQIMFECWEWDEKKRPTFYQLVHLLKNYSHNHLSLRKSFSVDEQKLNGNNSSSKTIVQF